MELKKDFKKRNRYYDEWVHTADLPLNSSDRDVVIEWLYKSNLIPWYVTYLYELPIEHSLVQESIGELWLIISEVKQEKWNELYEQGKMCVSAYVTGIIRQQVVSLNSRIYHKIVKPSSMEGVRSEQYWVNYAEEH